MGSTKSPTTDDLIADSSAGSSLGGREVLRIGVILPTEERHPVRWLAAWALGAELAWRNSPTDLQWFVQQPTASSWLHDATVAINTVPEDVSELGNELDVVVGFIDSNNTYDFWVDPASVEMTIDDAVALIPRYLTPSLVEEAHPAPSLSESILVDVTARCSDVVAAEVARHALSRSLPISLIGPMSEQAHFATQLARHGQSATDIGTDLDPEQFGSLIQRSAVVVTSDVSLHHLARILHGRTVLLEAAIDDQHLQRDLWRAVSDLPADRRDFSIEQKMSRLAEIVEQTALLRLGRSLSERTIEQESERNQQLMMLQLRQSVHWMQQRRRSQHTIDELRYALRQLEEERDTALTDAGTSRLELRTQHHTLNELEMRVAQLDQGPARLQRTVDWSSVVSQIERDLLTVLRWLRSQLGR
jgi:hypothetical protein